MPRTPEAVLPVGLTSASSNLIAFPLFATSRTSLFPSVIATSIKSSSFRLIAIMPFDRGRENIFKGVFLTVPLLVAINTKASSVNSLIGRTALILSPSSSGNRFIIGFPLAPLLANGTR